jgi:hypothetical protein
MVTKADLAITVVVMLFIVIVIGERRLAEASELA